MSTSENPDPNPTPSSSSGGEPGAVRIGDAERMHAVESLSRHFAEGRLDQSEFDDRTAAVYGAKTRGELSPLFFDLPGEHYPDPVYASAQDATARSAAVPARVGSSSPAVPDPHDEARARRNRIILGVTPLIALAVFMILGFTIGFHVSWVAWLAVPVVGIIVNGGEDEDDEDDEDDDEKRGRSSRRRRRELE